MLFWRGGARSDQNELNTQSFIMRGPQPDVYQAYEMALFYFVNVLFMAEKSSVTMFFFSEFGMCSKDWIAACPCVKWLLFVCCFLVSFLGGPVFLWDGWGGSGGRVRVGQEGREFGKHDQFQN